MAKQSAGLLMFRRRKEQIEVLLAHPGGPLWAGKERGVWTIPKGEFGPAEEPLADAVREFEEETGHVPSGPFLPLAPVRQHSGKIVHAWACEGDWDPAALRSNTFTLEWPPHSGRVQAFPEIDRAEWFTPEEARGRILPAQAPFLAELEIMGVEKEVQNGA
jgi:predicted NUDIX family NTP pyrophosphohydrolase